MKLRNVFSILALLTVVFVAGCSKDDSASSTVKNGSLKAALLATVPLGSASTFAVLAGTTVTNEGASLLTQNLGVSPGTAITGFQPAPLNTIMGPGTVTDRKSVV